MNDQIIYQMALRTFTPAGTLRAAADRLEHVANIGVDIIYMCAFFKADDDCDPKSWSPRQRNSHTFNPKNPYKIVDYFHVDSEYGTDEDLHYFVHKAHRLGLKVLFDLVYFHCGRNAVFIREHPDFVLRNEDGTVLVGELWPFARLNFESKELRQYLKSNMEYLIEEYGIDGFRCDVGDRLPFDFWQEAFPPLKKKYPHLITVNEGISHTSLEIFDWLYGRDRGWTIRSVFAGEQPANAYRDLYDTERTLYGKDITRLLRMLDNHDTVSDSPVRTEITMTSAGVEAALVLINTVEGVPFLWNGYEFCDKAENNMFSNRFHGQRSAMDWSEAFTADGQRRLHFIKELHHLRHNSVALCDGTFEWLENDAPNALLTFCRHGANEHLLIAINTSNHPVKTKLPTVVPIMQNGAVVNDTTLQLSPYGYLIAKM